MSGAPWNAPLTLPSFARNSAMTFAFQSFVSVTSLSLPFSKPPGLFWATGDGGEYFRRALNGALNPEVAVSVRPGRTHLPRSERPWGTDCWSSITQVPRCCAAASAGLILEIC